MPSIGPDARTRKTKSLLLRTAASVVSLLLLVGCVEVRVNESPAAEASGDGPADAAPAVVAEPTKTPRRRATRTPASEARPTKTPRTRATKTPQADGADIEADNGFRPKGDGLPFENYGNFDGVVNLTPVEVHRLFGDVACARFKNGACVLTPAGRKWMREMNKIMDGGHCQGFAMLSTLMYLDVIQPQPFGASRVDRLELEGNELLQREIAYWFVSQFTTPGAESERKDLTPSQVVDELALQFQRRADGDVNYEEYVIGVYQPGYEQGHALTPFAVDEKDDGTAEILVYDNNYPNETRAILVDRRKNRWQYQASINPDEEESLYKGTARTKTLTLSPVSALRTEQACPFCEEDGGGRGAAKLGAPVVEYNEIVTDGDIDLMLTDAAGRRLGIVGDEAFEEIPGAVLIPVRSGLWSDAHAPIYRIPRGVAFTATVGAGSLAEGELASFTVIGPGYALAVDGVELVQKQVDTIAFSADARSISYRTDTDMTPLLTVGIETDAADYEFEVLAEGDAEGQEVSLRIDPAAAALAITTRGRDETSTYDLLLTRYGDDEDDEETFEATGIELAAGGTDYVRYGEWRGQGEPLRIEFDLDDDGTMDESIDVNDAS
jgi:hypothetical protein